MKTSRRTLDRFVDAVMFNAACAAIASLAIALYVVWSTSDAPHAPDPSRGLTVAYENGGVVRYISETQNLWLNASLLSYVLCLAIFFPLLIYQRRRGSK